MAPNPNPSTPRKKSPSSHLSPLVCPEGMSLREWQVQLRKQMAQKEELSVKAVDEELYPGDYLIHNQKSQQDYKVVFRGEESEWNYCACLDFKTSQLGTCKHIEAVRNWIEENHKPVHAQLPSYTSVYLAYTHGRQVKIRFGSDNQDAFRQLAADYFDNNNVLLPVAEERFWDFLTFARQIDPDFRCYPDVVDYIIERRDRRRRTQLLQRYDDTALDRLLNAHLYPYQRDGIRFAFSNGRSIIADEMGLGKTLQAIGTAELMRREGFVDDIIIVCPTSLKYQWKHEIERFVANPGGRPLVAVVEGNHLQRRQQYLAPEPYKIVSYHALKNDIKVLGSLRTDLVVMDEVQRLKNWDTQLAHSARRISSPYAVVLSGTPLENKLEELYSIVELVDQFCLAPYYLFRNHHIITDPTGKVLEYKNLNTIPSRLSHVLLRRRKRDVQLQLPARTDQNLFVPMTTEQREIHEECKSSVAKLMAKWQRLHFLSETDRRRLLLLLTQMRMVCDSTYLLDQKSRHDTKLDEAINIIHSIVESGSEKVVVFSQWERMTRLMAQLLQAAHINFRYLHGGVPSKDRKQLIQDFTDSPSCRVFLSTDTGSTGLNLQAASVILNLDLPWNPAVLEQRIGRIYRIGQQNYTQVINLVSANTIEEQMIAKLRFKSSMAEGALDGGEDTIVANADKFQNIMEAIGTLDWEPTQPQPDREASPIPAEPKPTAPSTPHLPPTPTWQHQPLLPAYRLHSQPPAAPAARSHLPRWLGSNPPIARGHKHPAQHHRARRPLHRADHAAPPRAEQTSGGRPPHLPQQTIQRQRLMPPPYGHPALPYSQATLAGSQAFRNHLKALEDFLKASPKS